MNHRYQTATINRYFIKPTPKPRQTQSDKWKTGSKKRPEVARYHAFKEQCVLFGVEVPEEGSHVIFCLAMPKSWPAKKKAAMNGQKHQQKPDIDNLEKALLDSIYSDDSGVWDIRSSKVWSETNQIIIIKEALPLLDYESLLKA